MYAELQDKDNLSWLVTFVKKYWAAALRFAPGTKKDGEGGYQLGGIRRVLNKYQL